MPTLTFLNNTYDCAKALKGKDFVRLLDENNDIVFFADGISDFSAYVLSDGSWEDAYAVMAPTVGASAVLNGSKVVLSIPSSVKVETDLQVNFKAPCACTSVTALTIDGDDYTVVDTLGHCVTGKRGTWDTGSNVSVILNVGQKKAYIQNMPTYNRVETLTDETAALFGFGENAVPNDVLSVIPGKISESLASLGNVPMFRYEEYLESDVWVAPDNIAGDTITVLCCGGGGGGGGSSNYRSSGTTYGGAGGGGGSGYIEIANIKVNPGQSYNLTIGAGGAGGTHAVNANATNGADGGNTIFGNNLLTALGGKGGGGAKVFSSNVEYYIGGFGGDGGAGGGGGGGSYVTSTYQPNGGNGQFGGGGGAGGYFNTDNKTLISGGNGGTYGGGGAGGYSNGKKGVGGLYGGDGAVGTTAATDGKKMNMPFLPILLSLPEFSLAGKAGEVTTANTYASQGGGGFGGNGGQVDEWANSTKARACCGGGGFGGDGGTVISPASSIGGGYGVSSNLSSGGGGGGFGGKGGSGVFGLAAGGGTGYAPGGGGGGGYGGQGGTGAHTDSFGNFVQAENGTRGSGGGGATSRHTPPGGTGGNGVIAIWYAVKEAL